MLKSYKILLRAFILITLFIIVYGKRYKQHSRGKHEHRNVHETYNNALLIDAYSFCHSRDGLLHGRCTRFSNCPRAIEAWQNRILLPSCYFTTYENFVCCPDQSVMAAVPFRSAFQQQQSAPLLYPSNPDTNIYNNKPRISDEECNKFYFESKTRRNKRSNQDAATEDEISDEVIENERLTEIEAVGGLPTRPGDHPFMCALGWRTHGKNLQIVYNCGCVLIAKKYVLTAAHCANLGGESPSLVHLGGVDLNGRHADKIKIKEIIQHPEYKSDLAYNDIAIIKLERSSRKKPVCLWSIASLPQQTLTAFGYGQIKFAGPSSNSLLQVFLDVVTNEECSKYYKAEDKLLHGIGPGHICAGDPKGKMDTCQGDSGGPLVMNISKGNQQIPYLVGLTSLGQGCASGTPSIYTRISRYIDWIEETVW